MEAAWGLGRVGWQMLECSRIASHSRHLTPHPAAKGTFLFEWCEDIEVEGGSYLASLVPHSHYGAIRLPGKCRELL